MQIEQLGVVLRERSAWQAMELGTALVRRRAQAVWGAWLLASLPLLVLANGVALWRGTGSMAALLVMWWCKPLFERVVLYVLSRDVFGEPVTAVQALKAQRHWGGNGFWGYLGWRRPSLLRSVCLPVNLLEGAAPALRAQRRRAVLADALGPAVILAGACMVFEGVLLLGGLLAIFMFVPVDLLSDSWHAAWQLISVDTPLWAKIAFNVLCWIAASIVGPFHVGAGFGLYLNRRTQMEAWDVELGLRRLRERLRQAAPLLVLLLALGSPLLSSRLQAQSRTAQVQADSAPAEEEDGGTDDASLEAHDSAQRHGRTPQHADSPAGIFGDLTPVDTAGFRQAVQRAYEDPLQRPTRTVTRWEPRPKAPQDAAPERDLGPLGELIRTLAQGAATFMAIAGEWLLWGVLGIVLLILALTARRWLPWLRIGKRVRKAPPSAVKEDTLALPEQLPPDIATRARALWAQGLPRQALALLYRASVMAVEQRSAVSLPPGATEAEVLRLSRRMSDARDRELFAAMVRMWQYAAYGDQLPDTASFETLAGALQAQYRWPA